MAQKKNTGKAWPWVLGGLGVAGAGIGAWLLMRKKKPIIEEDPIQNAAAEAAGEDDEQVADQMVAGQFIPPGTGNEFIVASGLKVSAPPLQYTGVGVGATGPTFTVGPAKAVVMWGQGYDDRRWYVGSARQGVDWFRMMSGRYSINPPGVQGEWAELASAIEGSNKVWVATPQGDAQVKSGNLVPMLAALQPPPAMNFVMPGGIYKRLDENPWGYYISNDRLRKFWIRAFTGWTDDTSFSSRLRPQLISSGRKIYPTIFFFVRTPKEDEVFGVFHDIAQFVSEYFTGDDKSGMLAQGAGLSGDVKKSSRADIQERTKNKGLTPNGKNPS